jgi:hypothetical protein
MLRRSRTFAMLGPAVKAKPRALPAAATTALSTESAAAAKATMTGREDKGQRGYIDTVDRRWLRFVAAAGLRSLFHRNTIDRMTARLQSKATRRRYRLFQARWRKDVLRLVFWGLLLFPQLFGGEGGAMMLNEPSPSAAELYLAEQQQARGGGGAAAPAPAAQPAA